MTTYNIEDHVSGDTFLGLNFELKDGLGSPINIAGASIELKTTRDSNVIPLIITDGAGGKFQLPEQKISWVPATYDYRIAITFANGRRRSYIGGTWTIL